MKNNLLKDIIDNLIKSDSDKNNKHIEFGALIEDLQLDYSIEYDINYDRNDLLRCYYIASHICTDTEVGILAYFFNDELACVSTQSGRKSDENISGWTSLDMAMKVKEYIKSLAFHEEEKLTIEILDIEQDLGIGYPIEYTGQNLSNSVIYEGIPRIVLEDKSKGYTNFHNIIIDKDGVKTEVDIRDCLSPFRITSNADYFSR
jgi:hypothetical protein